VDDVLSHYYHITHDVVDKYEKGKNIINQDIVDFTPNERYDLIVSISTMEHVGWDETPCEPRKILRTLVNLKTLRLTVDGRVIIALLFRSEFGVG
jgi:cyclopropane fatty-acyl-phospholipid synthase-like methyltransferase